MVLKGVKGGGWRGGGGVREGLLACGKGGVSGGSPRPGEGGEETAPVE